MNNFLFKKTLTIPSGQQNSDVLKLDGLHYIVAIGMPAAFTGTLLKVLCSSASTEYLPGVGVTVPLAANMLPAYDGSDITITVAPSKYVVGLPQISANWVAIQSQSVETPARTIEIIYRAVE